MGRCIKGGLLALKVVRGLAVKDIVEGEVVFDPRSPAPIVSDHRILRPIERLHERRRWGLKRQYIETGRAIVLKERRT
jgi:hypothetical protein